MPVDVTVIIVSHNTNAMLRDCLESLFAETQSAEFEVIVVDNASSDGSCEMVANHFPRVKLIVNLENRGFAAANNQAIRIADGEFYVLLNSDTVILDRAIDKTLQYMKENRDVGALGPRVLWPDRELQSTVFRFHTVATVALEAVYIHRLFPRLNFARYAGFDWDVEHDVDAVAGCFVMVRREVVAQVGPLDEDFFMYGEEAEWCYRIRKAGWRVVYHPGATIVHIFGGSSSGRRSSLRAQLAKRCAVLLFINKTQGGACAWLANATMLLGLLPRLVGWLFVDALGAKRGREVTQSDRGERLDVLRFHSSGLVHPVWRRPPASTAKAVTVVAGD